MKLRHFFHLSVFGLKTILLRGKKPILGTIILTDYCNLKCSHCAVNNINKVIYPYEDIKRELQSFYKEGIRILFFCGGETLLWKDGDKDIRRLIKEARDMGFFLVNVVTNGVINLDEYINYTGGVLSSQLSSCFFISFITLLNLLSCDRSVVSPGSSSRL